MRNRTIKLVPGTDIVEVRYAGEVTYAFRLGTLDDLEALTPPEGFARLLVNYTSAWPAADVELRASAVFGARLGNLRFSSDARVALVNASDDVNAKTEAVALKPGSFLYRQFQDRAQAIDWLRLP